MFCSQCGVKASGNFCFQCGHRLQSAIEHAADGFVPAIVAWEDDAVYERVAANVEVRTAIASHAAQARPGLSADALMEIADKVVPIGVSYSAVTAVAQPMWASLGVRTGKERTETLVEPIGRVLAKVLCSLATHQQTVQRVEQAEQGCTILAELPSSIWAMKGELSITLARQDKQCVVTAATNIPGQAFDWGLSQRCLEALFVDLGSETILSVTRTSTDAA